MKTLSKATLFGLAIAGTCLLIPSRSDAAPAPGVDFDFGIGGRHGGFRIGVHGGHLRVGAGYGSRSCRTPRYRAPRRHVHHHRYAPHYERVWVAPTYRSVFVGHDSCGRPIYRQVCVRAGYYRRVLRGHRCGCGHFR